MTNILNNIQLDKIYTFLISDVIQILIVFFILYYVVKSIKDTRAWILAKGILIVYLVYSLVTFLKLNTIEYIMQQLFQLMTVAIIIMFQPELQRIFESLGKQDLKTWYNKLKGDKDINFRLLSDKTINEITEACRRMSEVKTGVLIVIEKDIPLENVIESGIDINADITCELLINIFEKNTPLHDGAVIIKDNKVRAATCYLPLSRNPEIQKSLGTRHRAGIGISENTDAIVVIVSEETGEISLCENGRISHGISSETLRKKLQAVGSRPTAEQERSKSKKVNSNKLSIKLVLAIVSILLWISITDSQDAIVSITLKNIPVTVTNDSVIDVIGQIYQVTSGETVNVKITGRRSIVSTINQNDIVAEADLRKLSQVYSVPIEVKSKKYNDEIEIETTNDDVMILALEDIVEKELAFDINVVGKPVNGKYLAVDEVDCDKIKVSAPETKAKSISKAVLTVNVDDKDSDFIIFVTPTIYDENNEEIDMNGVNISNNSIKVFMKAYDTKSVPITLTASSSSNRETYEVIDYSFERNNIIIAGDKDKLNEIEDINVDIDLSTSDDLASAIIVDMTHYVPSDIIIVDDNEKQLELRINTNKYIRRTVYVNRSNIEINGLLDNRSIEITKAPSSIVCYVLSTIDDITLDMLKPTLNINDNSVGNHNGTLELTAIEGVNIDSELEVEYEITRK